MHPPFEHIFSLFCYRCSISRNGSQHPVSYHKQARNNICALRCAPCTPQYSKLTHWPGSTYCCLGFWTLHWEVPCCHWSQILQMRSPLCVTQPWSDIGQWGYPLWARVDDRRYMIVHEFYFLEVTDLLNFHEKRWYWYKTVDPHFLLHFSLLNAVEDMFSSCLLQWCRYPSYDRFNENV